MEEQVDDKEAQPPPVPNKPVLRRQDTTLSEIEETQVSRWVDDTLSITQVRDITTQVDLHQATTAACGQPYWKVCENDHCKEHLLEKRKKMWFPGSEVEARWNMHIQRVNPEQDDCNQDLWERCLTTRCKQHVVECQAQGLGSSKN